MHLLFFRFMRLLSTLRITKLELPGKTKIAWRLGGLATRRLVADLPCGGTAQAVSPPTLFAPRPPTPFFLLHAFFPPSFFIHT